MVNISKKSTQPKIQEDDKSLDPKSSEYPDANEHLPKQVREKEREKSNERKHDVGKIEDK